jgi:hypothetical protein
LYKIIHDLLVQQLDEKETEVKKGEDIVETESNPDDPTATQEELSDLQVLQQNPKSFYCSFMLLSTTYTGHILKWYFCAVIVGCC